MIKKLHFQNFKSIRDNEIHLAPLPFLQDSIVLEKVAFYKPYDYWQGSKEK